MSNLDNILGVLEKGGSIRYFYLAGGYALHDSNDDPTKIPISSMQFLDLKDRNIVKFSHNLNHGWPHYSNNLKSSVYVKA